MSFFSGEITVEDYVIQKEGNSIFGRLYRPSGTGIYPAIIASHGYNGSHADFHEECMYYAKNGFVAYAYDFCGGSAGSRSSGSSTDMTITSEKNNLIEVVDAICKMDCVDKEHVFLLGGSQGGLVSSLVAEEKKEQIKAMALYFPALCIPDDWKKKYPDLALVPQEFDFWGLKLGKGFVEDVYTWNVFDTIGGFPKDVLIIHGDADPVVSYEYSKRAVKQYANAALIIKEGEGHGFSPACAKRANEEVLTFFKGHLD